MSTNIVELAGCTWIKEEVAQNLLQQLKETKRKADLTENSLVTAYKCTKQQVMYLFVNTTHHYYWHVYLGSNIEANEKWITWTNTKLWNFGISETNSCTNNQTNRQSTREYWLKLYHFIYA